jgi:serine/threonine protein kinase
VLELVTGASLDGLLRAGPLAIPAATRIGADVAEGLAAAHALGVVHRDVKPANVLVDAAGRAKVSDFGIARVRDSLLTATGTGLGTLDYMAPEQAEDAKRAGPGSDLYGLGATLFHAVVGRPPIDLRGGDPFGPLLTTVPPPLVRARPGCPPALSALVAALLEKHPDDRPSSAVEVARRLAELAR